MKVLRRPPLEAIIASWLSPNDQKVHADFTVIMEGTETQTEVIVFGLHKSEHSHFLQDQKAIWIIGWRNVPGGGRGVFGLISPSNRDSWLADFDNTAFNVEANQPGDHYGPVLFINDVKRAILKALSISKEMTGTELYGAEIAMAVIHSLSDDMMARHLNTPAPE